MFAAYVFSEKLTVQRRKNRKKTPLNKPLPPQLLLHSLFEHLSDLAFLISLSSSVHVSQRHGLLYGFRERNVSLFISDFYHVVIKKVSHLPPTPTPERKEKVIT